MLCLERKIFYLREACLPNNLLFQHILNSDTNEALHYYRNENTYTEGGMLKITTELKDNAYRAFNDEKRFFYNDIKHVQSGMLQSWNKFCYTGGIIEISAKLPGSHKIGGLWPARECYFVLLVFVHDSSYSQILTPFVILYDVSYKY